MMIKKPDHAAIEGPIVRVFMSTDWCVRTAYATQNCHRTKWGANISRKPPNALQGVSSCLASIVYFAIRFRVWLKHHLPCIPIQPYRPQCGISTDLGFSERCVAHAF